MNLQREQDFPTRIEDIIEGVKNEGFTDLSKICPIFIYPKDKTLINLAICQRNGSNLWIRHSRSEANSIASRGNRFRYSDPRLSQRGIEEARDLSKRVFEHGLIDDTVVFLVSPMTRCLETLVTVFPQANSENTIVVPHLREIGKSICEIGTPASTLRRMYPTISSSVSFENLREDWYKIQIPEHDEDVEQRMKQVMIEIRRCNSKGRRCVIVSHSLFIKYMSKETLHNLDSIISPRIERDSLRFDLAKIL